MTGLIVLPGIELPASDRAPLIMRPFDRELELCRRYYWKSFPYATAPAQNAGVAGCICGADSGTGFGASLSWRYPASMRAAPQLASFNPSAANAIGRDFSGPGDVAFVGFNQFGQGAETGGIVTMATSGTAGHQIGIHIVADARL
jgi:hypothetical protein